MNQPHPRTPAEMYEQFFVPAMFLPWAEILLRHAAPGRGERVLDIGCGTGIVARQAAPLIGVRGQLFALDVNPAMLAVASAIPAPAGAAIQWKEGSALALPVADGAIDLVLCQHALQFFPDRAGAVREMRRVLAPGGRAVVIVLQALARHPVFEALMESVARRLSQPIAAVMTPFALSDAAELQGLFEGAGYKKVEVFAESTVVRFAEPHRFVPMAVTSSAAAVPAFAQMDDPARGALMDSVRRDVEPVVSKYREADAVTFPMFAHIALGSV